MSISNNIPIGSQRLWKEDFIEALSKRICFPLNWINVGSVNKINIEVKVPKASGVYFFVRRSVIEDLSPFERYPVIVYIGLSDNLRRRLLDYVKDKQTALRYTKSGSKIRPGVQLMFRTYKDSLEVYVIECSVVDMVAVEDAFIKLFDPIFNEKQKMPALIDESEDPIIASYCPPQVAYQFEDKSSSGSALEAVIGEPQSAF